MLDCWMAEPGMRPSFTELGDKIAEELTEGNRQACPDMLGKCLKYVPFTALSSTL